MKLWSCATCMAPISFRAIDKVYNERKSKGDHDEVWTIAPIVEMGDAGNIGDIATTKK